MTMTKNKKHQKEEMKERARPAAEEWKTLRRSVRTCENCVNGQGLAGFRVYCSKHHREKRDKDVCPDHRFVREEFDMHSPTPFTDWVKKKKVVEMASKVLGFSLLSASTCSFGKGKNVWASAVLLTVSFGEQTW